MTLRKVLTSFSAGKNSAKSSEREAGEIMLSAPRKLWVVASVQKREEAASLSAAATLAEALLLILEDSILDQELSSDQQALFFAQNPELAIA